MAKYTTIYAVAGEELDLISWERILCRGQGDSSQPVGPLNTTTSIAIESVAMFLNDGHCHRYSIAIFMALRVSINIAMAISH